MGANDDLRVAADASSLASDLATAFTACVAGLLLDRPADQAVNIAIAGGFVSNTVLPAVSAASLDWSRIRVFWVDERFVAADDPQRNDREAVDALFCRTPGAKLFPMPPDGGQPIESARADYLAVWRAAMAGASLDLAILGMGPDGHIASLFPGHAQLDDPTEVLIEEDSPKPPPARLSLSLPVILGSRRIWLAAAGESKAEALRAAFAGADYHDVPVAALRGPRTTWWLDQAAASLL